MINDFSFEGYINQTKIKQKILQLRKLSIINSSILTLFKIEAKEKYIDLVNKLLKAENIHLNEKEQTELEPMQEIFTKENNKYKEIITSIEFGNVFKITLNRPNKFNAFSKEVNKINFNILIFRINYLDYFR